MHWYLLTKCIDANVCVCACVAVSIAISVVRFNRNALYCARQHLIREAVETSLIDLNCDGAIKIADLKSNISRSALKMTILLPLSYFWCCYCWVVLCCVLFRIYFNIAWASASASVRVQNEHFKNGTTTNVLVLWCLKVDGFWHVDGIKRDQRKNIKKERERKRNERNRTQKNAYGLMEWTYPHLCNLM